MDLTESQCDEIGGLKKWAAYVVSWLVILTLISLGLAVALLANA